MNKHASNKHKFDIIIIIISQRGQLTLPKRVVHKVRTSAPSFSLQHLFVTSRPFSNCLRLLLRLSVTYNFSSILPSITCLRRRFLRKTWWLRLAFLSVTDATRFGFQLNRHRAVDIFVWNVMYNRARKINLSYDFKVITWCWEICFFSMKAFSETSKQINKQTHLHAI
jgi:hypothetical protein